MSKIRKSARGETCCFVIPGVCNHDPETVVYCHAPHPDRGMGYKSHPAAELWGAYGCADCHRVMDDRGHALWSFTLDDQEYEMYWYFAIRETQRRLTAKGLIKV